MTNELIFFSYKNNPSSAKIFLTSRKMRKVRRAKKSGLRIDACGTPQKIDREFSESTIDWDTLLKKLHVGSL